MKVQTYWNKLKKTGWLDHVPTARHAEIKGQLARNLAERPSEAHAALAEGVIEAGESSPSAVLQALCTAATGHFSPREVSEKRIAKNVRLSFRLDQTEFASEMSTDPTTVVAETVQLANQSLSQSGRAERFFVLDGRDCGLIVFVPQTVLHRAREAKLIPGRKIAVEFAIASEAQAKEITVPAKKPGKSRVKRFFYEHVSLDALRELFEILCPDITDSLREILCTSHGAVVLRLAPDTLARLLAFRKSELTQAVRDWLTKPAMQDSPFAEEVGYCTDRLADVIGFLKADSKPKDSVLICVRPG